jgi:hypothetical protein
MKSIGIHEKLHNRLKAYCEKNDLNFREFIDHSLSYYEKSGSNPKFDESPRDEMNKLVKRLDQVIAFIRTQEKEYLRPAFEQVSIIEKRLKNDLENFTSKNDVELLKEKIKLLIDQINQILAGHKSLIDQIENDKVKALADAEKLNREIKKLISLLFSRSELGLFKDKRRKELTEQINLLLR